MRKLSLALLIFTFAVIAFAVIAGVPLAVAQTAEWQQINIPPLPPFHPQVPKRIVLPNGLVIFLQEDHELPLIDGVARIRGGSRSEAAAKVGLVDLYGEVWRTGGTKTQTGDQLDDYLEIRAAKVETSGNFDSTSISWSCLKADFDDVFKVFDDLLRGPEFRADKLDLAQKEYFDAISRRNDEIDGIAGREAAKLAYGPQNPYARVAEYSTVAAVSRQDLLDWHHTYVHPNNIVLGIVGDFDATAMEARLRQTFGAWPKGPAPQEVKVDPAPAKPGYYLIQKEDVNQSSINMVGVGIRRDNPDYYAVRVFNEAFGGGFSSRLFRKIRTEKGLACEREGIDSRTPIQVVTPCATRPSWARQNRSASWPVWRSMSRSTMWPSIRFPKSKSRVPRIPFSIRSSSTSIRPTKFCANAWPTNSTAILRTIWKSSAKAWRK